MHFTNMIANAMGAQRIRGGKSDPDARARPGIQALLHSVRRDQHWRHRHDFTLCVPSTSLLSSTSSYTQLVLNLQPPTGETKGHSLEEMDIVLGAAIAEKRQGDIQKEKPRGRPHR